jgi:hypothetical protein
MDIDKINEELDLREPSGEAAAAEPVAVADEAGVSGYDPAFEPTDA